MSTRRAYLNASLAQRGNLQLDELDSVDREMFLYLEEIQQQQQYLQVVAPLVDPAKGKDFLKQAEKAFFPHQEAADVLEATKTQQMLQEMQNKRYTIKRGPGGSSTLSVQNLDEDSL